MASQAGELFENRRESSEPLEVVFAQYKRTERLTWRELFQGFQTLRGITYSSSPAFIADLFDLVPEIEVIFGSPVSIKGDLAGLFAAQKAGIETIRDELGHSGRKLAQLLEQNRLRLFYARFPVHRKLFILEKAEGRRIISGSANLSSAAFRGLQAEQIFVFDEDPGMFAAALETYEAQVKESDPIAPSTLRVDGSVEIDQLPVFQSIAQSGKALRVEPDKLGLGTSGGNDPGVYFIKTDEYKRLFAGALPHVGSKSSLVTVDHFQKLKEQVRSISLAKAIERREIPHLEADPDRGEVRLNGTAMDLRPTSSDVAADAKLLDEFMGGYLRFFSGRVQELIQDYNTFLTWFFAAPFVCIARTAALQNDHAIRRYPGCGVLYGKSNAGKTDLTKLLLRAMFQQEWALDARDFNSTNFYAAAKRGGSFPIVVDDVSSEKFREPAKTIIKRDHQIGLFPVLVLSTNQDVRAVETDVLKRAILVHADASIPIDMGLASDFAPRIRKRIGTAL